MHCWKHFLALHCLLALLLGLALQANAQPGTANLTGIVEDFSHARIPGAQIKLINILTGSESDAATDANGVFLLSVAFQGTYILRIERDGFATAQVTGLILNSGDTKNLLVQLKIGPVTETMEVDVSGVILDTSDAAVGATVERKFVMRLPLNGRSFKDLMTITPGVLMQNPQALGGKLGGGVSVNGQRADANYILVDGVSGNFGPAYLMDARKVPSAGNLMGLTAMGTTQSLALVDALQEFRVLGSTYSAEFGTTPGGQISLSTRTGFGPEKGAVHGSAFDYRRYNAADSVDWFSGVGLPKTFQSLFVPYHQNDVGGTLGIRFRRLVAFQSGDPALFTALEQLHVEQPTAYKVQYVPDPEYGYPAGGPIQPFGNFPAAIRPILEQFPDSQGHAGPHSIVLAPFKTITATPGNVRAVSIRLDQPLAFHTSAFIRYNGSSSNEKSLNLDSLSTSRLSQSTYTLGTETQISHAKINEFRVGIATSSLHSGTSLSSQDSYGGYGFQSNFLADLGVPGSATAASGKFYMHIPGAGESTINIDEAFSSLRQWNVRDIFSMQAGPHFWRFGIDERRIVSGVNPAPLSIEADFFDQNSLVTNSASTVSITQRLPATPTFNEFSAFTQDEWKVSKSLTLSPGLRWEFNPAPRGRHGMDAYTLFGDVMAPATLQLARRGTPLWSMGWLNIAPRMGAAWSVHGGEHLETVVRAGAGIYFNSPNPQAANAFTALGFSATNHAVGIPVPIAASYFDFSAAPAAPYTNSTVYAFPRSKRLPYAAQWNVAIEQKLGKAQALTVSYIGAEGEGLLQEQRMDVSRQNPKFGEIVTFPGGITSNYQSLQLKFQRSIAPGVQTLASYGWSHALDYGSTDPAFPLKRGNSDVDVRQNLEAAVTWDEHQRLGNWLYRNVIGGWGMDGRLAARTGYPVTLEGNLSSDVSTGERYASGVNLVPGHPLYLYGAQYPGGRMFNGGPDATQPAFSLPSRANAGDAPRNQLRGFGNFQINADIRRDVHLHSSFNLQLRVEAFNLFNHRAFGYIDPNITDALFGQSTLLLNQSFGSAGSLYEPGGPRSLQFSARIHF